MGYFSEEDKKNIQKMKGNQRFSFSSKGSKGRASGRGEKGGLHFHHWSDMGVIGRIWRVVWILLLILVILAGSLVGYLSATEFHPKDTEALKVEKSISSQDAMATSKEFSVMTWNIGYGALGDNADFFMDGGSSVKTADLERVQDNMGQIAHETALLDPDFSFFQEVDVNSHRSNDVDEAEVLKGISSMDDSTFAYNYRVPFIPYPIPPIGKVNAGILTNSNVKVLDSTRYQLYSPYTWPESVGNLKRCLMVNRVKVEGSDKELVLVNLHLEAYDSGEGKIKQTKMLKGLLDAEVAKGNYVIAAGDFNQTFSNADISNFKQLDGMWKAGILDVDHFSDYQMLMDTSVPSCRSLDRAYKGADPTNFQYYSIDGFIVSKNITVKSIKTQDLGFKSSDHNPVLLRASLNP